MKINQVIAMTITIIIRKTIVRIIINITESVKLMEDNQILL